jgi:predicted metal-dependent hydrolase
MSDSKTLEIDGIPVLFKRSKRSKRINISVAPFYGVRVAVPYSSSFEKAEEFVRTKINWIKKHLEKIKWYGAKFTPGQDDAGYDNIDRKQARKILVVRLRVLAKQHGFSYNRVSIRNQKTRWGSCSSRNNISLNMKLVRLPEELIDYIILHELVHTKIKDHSKSFWAELDKLVGDGRQMRSRLKNYGAELYK